MSNVPDDVMEAFGLAQPKPTGGNDAAHITRLAKGAKHAWDKAAYGLERLVTGKVAPEHAAELAAYQPTAAGTVGEIGFDMAATAPLSVVKGAASIPQLVKALAVQAGYGGLTGSATNQAGTGAALGAAGGALPLVGKGVSAARHAILPTTPAARTLIEMGIQPSVGQSIGGGLNKMEQRASSWFPGSVAAARGRPLEQFQEKIIQRAVAGAKTLDEANDLASAAYDDIVPHLKPNQQTVALVNTAGNKARLNPELTTENQKLFDNIVDSRFANYGVLSGDGIKTLDSDIGSLIRKYSKSQNVSHHALADSLNEVQAALRQGMEHGLPPELQGKMATANNQWRQLIPINKAASSRADEAIRPRALQKAMARQAGTDVTRMKADPLVDSAVKVLPDNVPDSGTAGRVLAPISWLTDLTARPGASQTIQGLLTGGKTADHYNPALAAALLRQGTPAPEPEVPDDVKQAFGLE